MMLLTYCVKKSTSKATICVKKTYCVRKVTFKEKY